MIVTCHSKISIIMDINNAMNGNKSSNSLVIYQIDTKNNFIIEHKIEAKLNSAKKKSGKKKKWIWKGNYLYLHLTQEN